MTRWRRGREDLVFLLDAEHDGDLLTVSPAQEEEEGGRRINNKFRFKKTQRDDGEAVYVWVGERNWSRRAAASASASANLNPNVLKVICDAEGTKALKTHSLSDRAAPKTH